MGLHWIENDTRIAHLASKQLMILTWRASVLMRRHARRPRRRLVVVWRADVVLWYVVLLAFLGRVVLLKRRLDQQANLLSITADDANGQQCFGLLDPGEDVSAT